MKRTSRRAHRFLPFLAVPVLTAVASAAPKGADKTFIIATAGDLTPDGQNTIQGVDTFALSDRGAVYIARTVTTGAPSIYAVKRSGKTVIAGVGTVIPGVGTVVGLMNELKTNLWVEAASIAQIRDSSGVIKVAIVTGSSPQTLRVVAMQDENIPDGSGQYNSFMVSSFNDLGQVGFWASVKNGDGTISGSGVFLGKRDGTVVQVARSNDPVPDEPYEFWSLAPKSLTSVGHFYFSGNFKDADSGPGPTERIYRREPWGAITRVFRSRQAAPGTPWLFGGPSAILGVNPTGQYVLHTSLIDETRKGMGSGIYHGTDGDHLSPVAVTGQTAPSGMGTYTGFDNMPTINLAGKVAYVANFDGGFTTSGLFTYHNGQQKLLCRTGQTAPGGNVFSGFLFPVINDSGAILFGARLNGNQSAQGVYLTDGNDTIKMTQAGDTVGGRTILSIGIDPKAFNGSNQLIYQAFLSGAQGEPSLLLFAPRIRWRGRIGGIWENAFNWTASLVPSDYNDVDIIPPDGIDIDGPLEDTTIGHLSIATEGEGVTDFNLKSGVITATAGVSIDAGGMLSGSGTIIGNVSNASLVSPGNSPGTIALTGDYDQGQTGRLEIEIAGEDASKHDLMQIDGDVNLAGDLDVALLDDAIDQLGSSSEIAFLTATGQIAGGFANFPVGARVPVSGGLASFQLSSEANAITLRDFQALDSDSDGVPDYWMLEHFGEVLGDAGNASAATDDADSDGTANHDEYVAGTDPKDGTSSFAALVSATGPEEVTIHFSSVAGRTYGIEFSEDLGSWAGIRSGIVGDGNEKEILVGREESSEQGYYRVTVAR